MSPPRRQAVDAVKLIAAFGVVVIHLAPSTPEAEALTRFFLSFAVPFFLLISLYFLLTRLHAAPELRLAYFRFDRILVPYAMWTIIYISMRLLKFSLQGKSLEIDPVGAALFGGAAVQLYFLPLLLLFQAQMLTVFYFLRGGRGCWIAAGLLGATLAYSYLGSLKGYFGFDHAFELGLHYLALAFLLAYTQRTVWGCRINLGIGCVTVAGVIFTSVANHPLPVPPAILGAIVGYGASAFALNCSLPLNNTGMRYLLTCSFSIYLAHFAFLESFEFGSARLGYAVAPYSVGEKLGIAVLICVGCIALLAMARRYPPFAYLLFGEGSGIPHLRQPARAPVSEVR